MTLRSLFTAGALVTIGMLVGRILGLLREMLLAGTFGASTQADTAIMLLIIPDFITGALLGGAVSATLVPAFAARSMEQAVALMWQVLLVSVGALSAIALLLFFNESAIRSVITADIGAPAFLTFLASLPLTAATAILTAWLQYRNRFTVIAFATAIFNGVIILALWLMPVGLAMLAVAIMLATLIRLLVHVAALYRAEGRIPRLGVTPWQMDKPLLKSYGATASTGLFSMFPQYAPYAVIAAAGAGVAIFNYAFKLILMPAMIAQGVLQMVLLPWLVHHRKNHGSTSPHSMILQCTWLLSLAMCLSLSLASYDIAALCFRYGKMTDANVREVAQVFAIGVWALPGMLLSTVWQQIMYAQGNARSPLFSNVLLALAVFPACWAGKAVMGLEGVAMMYAAIQVLPVLWLAYVGYKQGIMNNYVPSLEYGKITLMVVAAWLPLAWLFATLALSAPAGLCASIVIGGVTLAAGLSACPPVKSWLWQRVGR